MLKYFFIFISLFFVTFSINSSLSAKCSIDVSGNSIYVSACDWTTDNGNLGDKDNNGDPINIKGSVTYNIKSLKSGYIPEIIADKQEKDKTHSVYIEASQFEVGKMWVGGKDNPNKIEGKLELTNNSKLTFTKEGLRTGAVNLKKGSTLTISGAESNSKIEKLEVEADSSVTLNNKAKLELNGGEIFGKLYVAGAGELTLNYSKKEDEKANKDEEKPEENKDDYEGESDDDKSSFNIKFVDINGRNLEKGENTTIIKKGNGKVIFNETSYTDKVKIKVEGGILDVADIGSRSELPPENFTVSGKESGIDAILKYKKGNFSTIVEDKGFIHHYSDDGTSEITINSGKPATGTFIEDGKSVTVTSSNLDKFIVKKGNVNFDSKAGKNHVNNLIIRGGVVNSGTSKDNNLTTFDNIEISNKGMFNYVSNDFSKLESLKVYDYGIFSYQGRKDLTLDGSKFDFSNNGTLRVFSSTDNGKLTLKNIGTSDKPLAFLDLQTNKDHKTTLEIGENVYIKRLILDVTNPDNVYDVEKSSNIKEVEMKRQGTINIKKDGKIDSLINNSPFTPKINIESGGFVDILSLNQSGIVKVKEGAKVNQIDLTGSEKVDIEGGDIENLNVNSKNKKAELNMQGGTVKNFKLNSLIEFTLKDTEITNYEIGLRKEEFDFKQENVKNLILKGKGTTVNIESGNTAKTLESITLDYGNIVYNIEGDKTFKELTTTFDHLNPPKPEECKPDDEKCKEEQEEDEKDKDKDKDKEKIVYDSELRIKAGKSTVTVGDVKLENLVLESGNLVVTNDMEIQRRLNLDIDSSHRKPDENSKAVDDNFKVYANGNVYLAGLFEVDFTTTYDALLNKDNQFNLIYSEKGIIKGKKEEEGNENGEETPSTYDDETSEETKEEFEFKFLTNLANWFEVDENKFSTDNSFILNIKRTQTYGEVLSQNGYSGGLSDIASILDSMITGRSMFTNDMKEIISGLDTKSKDVNGLIRNLSKLLPVSNRVYANSIHSNTSKSVDNLSLELRDFTNFEDNAWVKMQYNTTNLKSKNDIIGYSENSNMMQAGYTRIFTPKLTLGGSLSYINGRLNGNDTNYNEDFTTLNVSLGADYLLSSNYYLKGILSYSYTDFDNTRNLSFIKRSSNSSLGANEAMAHIEAGYVTVLPEQYYDFNASYNMFYSISSVNIDSYVEKGIGRLNVNGANAFINDIGIGVVFDKLILYDREEVSLKPTISFATGARIYSGVDTNFNFIDIKNNQLSITSGSYLPLFFKTRLAIDYIADWANISVGYRYDGDIVSSNDTSFYLSIKHSF